MKPVFFCTVLILAGAVSCEPIQVKSIILPNRLSDINLPHINLPENVPEWIVNLFDRLPDSITDILEKLPEIVAEIPGIVEDIIKDILDKLPEIIAQVPAVLDRIKEIVINIIEKLPEVIPIILDKIPEIIAQIPDLIDRIKEILEDLDLPDWFPNLPGLEKPEWWPESLPELPEYNRPVAGTPASINEFPGIVQIEVGTGPVWAQGCAGSVLTSFHVLSAARCFSGRVYNPRFRRVRAGSSTRYTDGSIVEVDHAINHPSFGPNSSEGDVAVVRLLRPLTLSANIQQTAIVAPGFIMPANTPVVHAGWGSTAQGGLISDRDLYSIELVTVDNDSCAARWGRIPLIDTLISPNVICVGRAETGGRNGDIRDIGSPVYYDNILVGVTSIGAPVGNQYFPVIATSVAPYTNWIVANAV